MLSQTLVSWDKRGRFTAFPYPSIAGVSIFTVAWVKWPQHPVKQQEFSEVCLKVGVRKPFKKKVLLSNGGLSDIIQNRIYLFLN